MIAYISEAVLDIINSIKAITPSFIASVVILIVGYAMGRILSVIVKVFLSRILNVDEWLKRKNIKNAFYGVGVSDFYSSMIKWYIYLIFIAYALNYIEINLIKKFAKDFMEFVPRIFAVIFITSIGIIIGEKVRITVKEFEIPAKREIGSLLKLMVVYIFFVFSLQNLGFNATIFVEIFRIALLAVILTFSIALGISLGYALKDVVRRRVEKFLEEVNEEK